MAHEIWTAQFGAIFIERESRVPAWHGLGKKFEAGKKVTLREAMIEIGMDYEVEVVPEQEFYNGKLYHTGNMSVWRKDHRGEPAKKFGICSTDWKPVDNLWLADTFDPAQRWFPLETMGALKDGRLAFFTLNAGEFEIDVNGKADGHQSYIYVSDYKMPGKALIIGAGSVRIVCANTHAMAMSGARFLLPLEHTSDIQAVAPFIAESLSNLGSAREAERQALQMLARREMSVDQVKEAFSVAWLTPKPQKAVVAVDSLRGKATDEVDLAQRAIDNAMLNNAGVSKIMDRKRSNTEYLTERVNMHRNFAMVSLMNMADNGYGMNAYSVLEAVIETEEHRALHRGDTCYDMVYGNRSENIQRVTDFLTKGQLSKVAQESIANAVWTGEIAGVPGVDTGISWSQN